jgi:hypothetical protein
VIRWSQPEIVLYDDDPVVRMSYPDLVEDGGRYFLTETQKDIARVHEIDAELLAGLWGQFENKAAVPPGALLELPGTGGKMPASASMPELPAFIRRSTRADHGSEDVRAGFSIDLRASFRSLAPGQMLLDNRTSEGKGFALRTAANNSVEILLNDGRSENRWSSDPGLMDTGKQHRITVIVDGGPKIISFVVDGKLCDGGDARQFGWGRFSPNLQSLNGDRTLRIGPDIVSLRLYGRALRTSEAVH